MITENKEDVVHVLEEFLKESEADRGLNLKKKYIHAAIKEIKSLRKEIEAYETIQQPNK